MGSATFPLAGKSKNKHKFVEQELMALPIKDTPVLKGEDAREFERQIKISGSSRVSPEELSKLKAAHDLFCKLYKNTLNTTT